MKRELLTAMHIIHRTWGCPFDLVLALNIWLLTRFNILLNKELLLIPQRSWYSSNIRQIYPRTVGTWSLVPLLISPPKQAGFFVGLNPTEVINGCNSAFKNLILCPFSKLWFLFSVNNSCCPCFAYSLQMISLPSKSKLDQISSLATSLHFILSPLLSAFCAHFFFLYFCLFCSPRKTIPWNCLLTETKKKDREIWDSLPSPGQFLIA